MICSLCDARCCKTRVITITAFDMYRIWKKGKKIEEFVELRRANLLNIDFDQVLICNDNGFEDYYLLTIKSHPCVFLKDNKCSIYEYAPLVCKVYPFNVIGKLMKNTMCPLITKPLFYLRGEEGFRNFLYKENEEYKKIVEKWNKIKGSREECIDFLLKEAGKRSFKKIGNLIILDLEKK